jgi:hypothetical protein
MGELCFRCAGKGKCDRKICILKEHLHIRKTFNDSSKKDFFGENYNIMIGHHNYPNINVGLLNTDTNIKDESIDDTKHWVENKFDINEIIQKRSMLINSSFKTNIRGFNDRLMDVFKEVSIASKPVDTEIYLNKKPEFKLVFNNEVTPHGPRVELERARITENVHIPQIVDKITNDEITSRESLKILYTKGFDNQYLTKILSSGHIGFEANKKLVPTRWSITAVDDSIGKDIIREIKNYPIISEYRIYFGSYFGNYYIILSYPEVWSYELFETMIGNFDSSHDFENYFGRKEYAHSTAGGYYAARLSILEHLKLIKKQSTCIALRFVSDEYWAPLGVWVVRQAVKNAMKSKPILFNSKEEMISFAKELCKKYNYDIEHFLDKSVLHKQINIQKKLIDY